jgi:phosphoserine aminotransferase
VTDISSRKLVKGGMCGGCFKIRENVVSEVIVKIIEKEGITDAFGGTRRRGLRASVFPVI